MSSYFNKLTYLISQQILIIPIYRWGDSDIGMFNYLLKINSQMLSIGGRILRQVCMHPEPMLIIITVPY